MPLFSAEGPAPGRRRRTRYVVPVAPARDDRALRVGPGGALPDAEGERLPPVSLPGDELPHAERSEWWYFALHLTLADDPTRRVTLLFIVLKEHDVGGLPAALGVVHHVDHDVGMRPAVTQAQLMATTFDPLPPPEFYRFRFSPWRGVPLPLATWSVRGGDGFYRIRMSHPYDLDLRIEPGIVDGQRSRPVLLGDRGRLDYGSGRELAYYVWTNLAVTGSLETDAGPRSVWGHAWLDRQWGSVPVRRTFWKYVTVQTGDGHHWMFFRLRHTDLDGQPQVSFAVHVTPWGRKTEYREGVEVADVGPAPPPDDGYAAAARVTVAAAELDLEVTPLFAEQEIVPRFNPLLGRIPFAPRWFEGVSRATGTIGGAAVEGADAMIEIYDPARQAEGGIL